MRFFTGADGAILSLDAFIVSCAKAEIPITSDSASIKNFNFYIEDLLSVVKLKQQRAGLLVLRLKQLPMLQSIDIALRDIALRFNSPS
ncbi:MAG TPA: hypothetical protein VK641_09455 [Terriglobales bacterium]|nr:hypothetical protein [Terriglobales bacterium]